MRGVRLRSRSQKTMEEEEVNGRPNHFTRARPAHKRGTWRKGNQILRHNTRPNRQRGCQRKKGETEREDLRKKKAWVEKPAKIKQNSLEKRSWDCKWQHKPAGQSPKWLP